MPAGGSTILLEEMFDAEDPRFAAELRKVRLPQALAGLAGRWGKDPRPWARRQLLEYLDLPLDAAGHQPLVKRLFKQAERDGDDERMAAFLAAFDRLVRRRRRRLWHWDSATRSSWEEEVLATPRDGMPGAKPRPGAGARRGPPGAPLRGARLFSHHTRYYLRRRAWRYFRRLGFARPADYPAAIARALLRYRDADLAKGENILDSWGLLHACFGRHPAIAFDASRASPEEGRGLGALSAAPAFPGAWRAPAAAEVLLSLVSGAPARLVRVWAIQLLRAEHKGRLAEIGLPAIRRLLECGDEEVQQFGAELLAGLSGLGTLPVAEWLSLLGTKNLAALELVCQAMGRHVSAERLDLGACVQIACARPAPVARMGLKFLQARPGPAPGEGPILAGLGDAMCAAAAGEIAAFALGILGAPRAYAAERVCPFFDSGLPEARAAALAWLAPGSPGWDDPVLWSRLAETPFDDVRLWLVRALERRAALPGSGADLLEPVWCSVLLGIQRGGRQKATACRQIGRALEADPSLGARLVPVLAVAVRSIRAPEMRAGLSALVSAMQRSPLLAEEARRRIPELSLAAAEAAPR